MSDATSALLRAIRACFPDRAITIQATRSRPWASGTFSGVRHEIGFAIGGEGAAAAADAFLDGLEDREFTMRSHVLVEIALVSRTGISGKAAIMVEALTIEDA